MKIIFLVGALILLMILTILQGRPEPIAQNHEISPASRAITGGLDEWSKEPLKGGKGFF